MKIALNFKFCFLAVVVSAIGSLPLFAQEENFSSQEIPELKQQQHSELNLEDDKTLFIEVDSKPVKMNTPSTSVKETPSNGATSQSAKKSDSGKTAVKDKGEEDALNFNFLYFIIQRFKISDIVDD